MPRSRSRSTRLFSLSVSNILLPIAVLIFASGFFPYKPVLPGLATFEDVRVTDIPDVQEPEAVFDRVVFMVVDALRSDFVYGYNSGFEFTQSLIRSGAAIPFTAHATPPTVTMPRVKALTTGSVPSFLDLILNFAESDTTSSLATQDTWLAQIRAKGGNLVFYGDDTWLKLFPQDFFLRSDGTSSFFVSDFTEVDNNVTRHVPDELARDDWNAMIMHYLGLDHIGHKTGPQGPNMLPKQWEMDGIVRQIYDAMEKYEHHSRTLLVLAGDHGMNAGGNHGGSGPGETEPALLFASPRFKTMKKRRDYECPTSPREGTEFHFYTKVEQSDLLPNLAGMMGFPISKNSLGVCIPELGGLWPAVSQPSSELVLLLRNAEQLLHVIRAKYGAEAFDHTVAQERRAMQNDDHGCKAAVSDEDRLACDWARVLHSIELNNKPFQNDFLLDVVRDFLKLAQDTMSDTASSYDIPRMATGMSLTSSALVLAVLSFPSFWPPTSAGVFLTVTSLLYGIMMFASSYVEEEQHFWYWLTPVWVTILTSRRLRNGSSTRDRLNTAVAGTLVLGIHRVAVRWNQTGQKHAGDRDIVHTFFPDHHIFMWVLVLAAYIGIVRLLHIRTFAGLLTQELKSIADVVLFVLPIVFKLNFTQADAPELVEGLALRIREWSEPFSLVLQARAAFAAITGAAVVVGILSYRLQATNSTKGGAKGGVISLVERLHYLLTLFLMTQVRAPNIPLVIGLELQRLSLLLLLSDPHSGSAGNGANTSPPAALVATMAVLMSHVYYFCMGGSNSISSIDLSNAYNGVADYNIAAVGVLLFASNWAGPIWWCSTAVMLCTQPAPAASAAALDEKVTERDWVMVEREKLHDDAIDAARSTDAGTKQDMDVTSDSWFVYVACTTAFIAIALLAVMAACTALRTHLFIWTVFSPKYLYALAWSLGWHLIVNIGLGSLLFRLSSVR